MRALLCSVGTRGDVQPVVALGRGLRARGHEVALAVPPENAEWIEREGFEMFALGSGVQSFIEENIANALLPHKVAGVLKRMFAEEIPKQVDTLVEVADRFKPDLVAQAGLCFVATTAAERAGAQAVWLMYAPTMVPSSEHAPAFVPVAGLPKLVNRAIWGVFKGTFARWVERPMNVARVAHGFAPLGPAFSSMPHLGIAAWDEPLGGFPADYPPLPDMPEILGPLGHLGYDHTGALDGELSAFLDAGEPPVYLGFGSMADTTPETTIEALAAATRALDRRAVILTGWSAPASVDVPGHVYVTQRAPHPALFARCCVLVHHGGAGTTATAGRAGKPQVIVPHLVDQFDWARRLRLRGVAPASFKKSKLNAARLTRALREALAPQMVEAARQTGEALASVDGVAAACEALESYCARSSR